MNRLAISLTVIAALVRVASADPEADAKPHVEAAQRFYAAGKTAEALDELNIAYTINPTPTLLYAIAQAHVVLDQCDEAIKFYEQFLATHPKPGPAKLAHEAIDHCIAKLGNPSSSTVAATSTQPATPAVEQPSHDQAPHEQPPAQQQPPVETAPEPPREQPAAVQPHEPVDTGPESKHWYKDPIADVLVGGGVAASVVGIVLYTQARGDLDDAQMAADYSAHHQAVEDARSKRTIAVVTGVSGVALLGAGIAYIVLSRPSKDSGVALAPAKGGAVVTWGGHF